MSKHVVTCFLLFRVKLEVIILRLTKEISFEDGCSKGGDIVISHNSKYLRISS